MQQVSNSPSLNLIMQSFLVRKVKNKNFTKTLSLRAKVPNTYGKRLLYCRLLKVICFCVFLVFSSNLFARRPYQIQMPKFMTADEAIAYFENLNSSFSESDGDTDNDHEGYASSSAIILPPLVERPDAITDEDSDDDDTNDINHLPRRIVFAEVTFKKKASRLNCSAAIQENAGPSRAKETEILEEPRRLRSSSTIVTVSIL